MKSLNKITLIGNLGQDPEVKYMQSGDAVASFSLVGQLGHTILIQGLTMPHDQSCRHCRHWERRAGGEDCAKHLLMRQPVCRGFEREVGADDDMDPEDADTSIHDAV